MMLIVVVGLGRAGQLDENYLARRVSAKESKA